MYQLIEIYKKIAGPAITKQLKDVEIMEGEPRELFCEATGTPEPSVQWYYYRIFLIDNKL